MKCGGGPPPWWRIGMLPIGMSLMLSVGGGEGIKTHVREVCKTRNVKILKA